MVCISAPSKLSHLLFVVILASSVIIAVSRFYKILRLESDETKAIAAKHHHHSHNYSVLAYMLFNGFARPILHNETISFFEYDPNRLNQLSQEEFSAFHHLRKPAPLIKRADNSVDEIMRTTILKIEVFQDPLLRELTYIGAYINPSIIPWHKHLFLCTGLCWTIGRLKYVPEDIKESIQCSWLNHSMAPIDSYERYLGLGIGEDTSPLSQRLNGQDPRFLHINGNVTLIAYTFRRKIVSMGIAEIHSDGSNNFTLSHIYPYLRPDKDGNRDQKNWSPFLWNNSVCFVQSINPLHVVSIGSPSPLGGYHTSENPSELLAKTVSMGSKMKVEWEFGDLRGGTNAVYLKDELSTSGSGVYLSLFHSCTFIPGNAAKTYFMGAYTFSAHPPFTLLKISPVPIVDPSLYDGPWNPLRNRGIDYVVFPMSLFVDSGGHDLVVSFGHQDHTAFTAKIGIKALMSSLMPVEQAQGRR